MENMKIKTAKGEFPLTELVDYHMERGPVAINRYNGSREIRVEAETVNPFAPVPEILEQISNEIMPDVEAQFAGIRYEYQGQQKAGNEAMAKVIPYFSIAFLLIIFIMIIHFKSFNQTLIILAMIPLSMLGVFWGHGIHGKPLSEIKEDDLCALIDDQVPEGKSIEYKVSLPGNSDKDKKEFLADISSFSNSAGGHIFFGISESNGLPQELVGLEGIDPDGQILRLLNLLRDSIAPRIPGVNIRAIPIENKGPIIAIKVPRSCISPHMVTFAGISKFYSRNSAGKYQL